MQIVQLRGLSRAYEAQRTYPTASVTAPSSLAPAPAIDARVLREPLHRPDCGSADSVSVVISARGVRRGAQRPARSPERPPTRVSGPVGRGTESTFQPERCVVLMPYRLRNLTGEDRPLPAGSDTVPECRDGIRRWSG